MASSQINRLFDLYTEQEAEAICNAALSTSAYKFQMRVAAATTVIAPFVLGLLVFLAIRTYQPAMPVRLIAGLLVVAAIFLAIRLIFPINDRLIDRAISKELTRRGTPPAL